jgi:hypothetical protein
VDRAPGTGRDGSSLSPRLRLASLVASGLLAGALMGEFVLRLGFPSYRARFRTYELVESERGKFTRYDALLGWAGIPNATGTFEWLDCRHEVRQNRFGWRGPAYEPGVAAAPRLVVLGDSFVWGFGVEEDEIFTRVLERESPAPIEVVNMGVAGYGTDQELLAWRERGHEWGAQGVLLAITTYTDLYDDIFAERDGYPKPFFRLEPDGSLRLANVPVPRRGGEWEQKAVGVHYGHGRVLAELASHSAVVSLALEAASRQPALRRLLEQSNALPPRLGGYDWERDLYRRPLDTRHRAAWALLFALVRELQGDVKREGGRLSVLLVPSVVEVYPELWAEFAAKTGGDLDPGLPNRLLHENLDHAGLTVIDPLPALRDAGRRDPNLYFPANRHWTAAGHRIVARVLRRELLGAGP